MVSRHRVSSHQVISKEKFELGRSLEIHADRDSVCPIRIHLHLPLSAQVIVLVCCLLSSFVWPRLGLLASVMFPYRFLFSVVIFFSLLRALTQCEIACGQPIFGNGPAPDSDGPVEAPTSYSSSSGHGSDLLPLLLLIASQSNSAGKKKADSGLERSDDNPFPGLDFLPLLATASLAGSGDDDGSGYGPPENGRKKKEKKDDGTSLVLPLLLLQSLQQKETTNARYGDRFQSNSDAWGAGSGSSPKKEERHPYFVEERRSTTSILPLLFLLLAAQNRDGKDDLPGHGYDPDMKKDDNDDKDCFLRLLALQALIQQKKSQSPRLYQTIRHREDPKYRSPSDVWSPYASSSPYSNQSKKYGRTYQSRYSKDDSFKKDDATKDPYSSSYSSSYSSYSQPMDDTADSYQY